MESPGEPGANNRRTGLVVSVNSLKVGLSNQHMYLTMDSTEGCLS